MTYRKIKDLRQEPPKTSELPFVKRHPSKEEHEFRLIYEGVEPMLEAKDVPFDPIALLRVILNPSDAAGGVRVRQGLPADDRWLVARLYSADDIGR